MKKLINNNLFLIYFILLFITFVFSCSSRKISNQDLITNPDSLIVNEIGKKKIVMIGETLHSNVIPYYNLINVLFYWLENNKQNINPVTLNLILERDSTSANIINYFIKTGNLEVIKHSPQNILIFSDLETLNFYSQLRIFNSLIDSINNINNKKINFKIYGFEDIGTLDTNFLKKDKRNSELYFINERDKNTSDKIIKFIKNRDTNNHFLIFYGSAHIQYGYISKDFGFEDIDSNLKKGYYISNYLKNEFGFENVITFNRIMRTKDIDEIISFYNDKFIAIPSNKFPLKYINPERFDYIVIDTFLDIPTHKIGIIFSKFVIDNYSELIKINEKLLPGYKAENSYYNLLSDIYFITGNKFKNYDELNLWIKQNPNFDGIARLSSVEFKKQLFNLYGDSYSNFYAKYLLKQFGFAEEDFQFNYLNYDEWEQKVWKNVFDKIKVLNSIGFYWIGYPYEKLKAKSYLEEHYGEKSDDPNFYYQLYIKEYYNFNLSK